MEPFIFNSKTKIADTITKLVTYAKTRIEEEIRKQVPDMKAQLQSEGLPDDEIEQIIEETNEEQFKLSMAEFHRLFLMEKQKIFPSRK